LGAGGQVRDPAPHYKHTGIGYNYRLSNVLAAIGRGQLQVLDERVCRKREIFETYWRALGHLPGVAFMPEVPWGRHKRRLRTQIKPKKQSVKSVAQKEIICVICGSIYVFLGGALAFVGQL